MKLRSAGRDPWDSRWSLAWTQTMKEVKCEYGAGIQEGSLETSKLHGSPKDRSQV